MKIDRGDATAWMAETIRTAVAHHSEGNLIEGVFLIDFDLVANDVYVGIMERFRVALANGAEIDWNLDDHD